MIKLYYINENIKSKNNNLWHIKQYSLLKYLTNYDNKKFQ